MTMIHRGSLHRWVEKKWCGECREQQRQRPDRGRNKMPFLRTGGGLKVYGVSDLPPESKLRSCTVVT